MDVNDGSGFRYRGKDLKITKVRLVSLLDRRDLIPTDLEFDRANQATSLAIRIFATHRGVLLSKEREFNSVLCSERRPQFAQYALPVILA